MVFPELERQKETYLVSLTNKQLYLQFFYVGQIAVNVKIRTAKNRHGGNFLIKITSI